MLMGLQEFAGHKLRSVDEADIDLSDVGAVKEDETSAPEPLADDAFAHVQERFKSVLGGRVRDVIVGKSMFGSPARLVSDDSTAGRNMFRINRLLDKDYKLPVKTLELNPRYRLIHNLNAIIGENSDSELADAVIEQIFETALLQDGIHPDPAAMADRLTLLMQAATGTAASELNFADTLSVPEPAKSAAMPDIDDMDMDEAEPIVEDAE
jgi:molecular chaperone HtpG